MNPKLQKLLDHYSESHRHFNNQMIHKFAVPSIMLSLLGLLDQLRWNELSAAWVLVIFALFYYSQFRELKIYFLILPQVVPMLIFIKMNQISPIPLYLSLFVVAWIAQFIGHKIEGKKPSFFEDLQYLLIGPIWIVKNWAWPSESAPE